MKKFLIESQVWRWPGTYGWHFAHVDRKLNGKIRANSKSYGSGFIKIRATVGNTSWDTALFPYKKEDCFLISIKSSVRKKEDIFEGDKVKIKFEI
jgi:hypothetical protein